MSARPAARKPGKIKARAARARQAALKAAALPAAGLTIGAVAEAAHVPPGIPYGWIALGAIGALKGRDAMEEIVSRRGSGKLAQRRKRKYQGTAGMREVHRKLSVQAARKRAKVTRPALGGTRRLPAGEAGIVIGRGGRPGRTLMGTAEDFYLLFAPPRSGKTGFLSGVVMDAPGAVLTTSTRVDVYGHTVIPRERKGPVVVLNPGMDGGIPTSLFWSPLEGCHTAQGAITRAGYLIHAAPKDSSGKDAYWDAKAHDLLRLMMHAAALGGGDMTDVQRWVSDPRSPEPAALLSMPAAAGGWDEELAALAAQEGEQLQSIMAGAAGALRWLSDPVMRMIACPPPDGQFDAWEFLEDCGTLYMIGTDRPHNSLAPFFACLTAHLFDTAKAMASYSEGFRLDPPLTLVIDEPAVTCPVPLDKWSAEAGGHGITLVTGVQSPAQLVSRWGEHGARTIRDNASVQLVFGGKTDEKELEALSAVCGSREVRQKHKTPVGGRTHDYRTERLYPPERLRTLPDWTAVLLHRSARPVTVTVTPVWARPGYEKAPAGYGAQHAPAETAPLAIEAAPPREAIPMPAAPDRDHALTGSTDTTALPDPVRSTECHDPARISH